jgi:Glycosyl transferases group 1
MTKTVLKFLITPNYAAPYDQRMVNGLADGLNAIGHQALALSTPISSREVATQCEKHSIDIVLQVNRTRSPDIELPKNIRYISWYQDVFPETVKGFAECFRESDILYALGDPKVLGLEADMPCNVGCLLSGVDQRIFNHKKSNGHAKIDFSLCGFIPAPPRTRGLFEIMLETVEQNYQPLSGSLDIHELELVIRENMAPYPNTFSIVKQKLLKQLYKIRQLFKPDDGTNRHLLSPFERSISFYTREYPRLLDRVTLINKVLKVSDSLELYGPGWDRHKKFRNYSKGIVSRQEDLLDIYCKSRINLANNTHGLGLHSRTFECMAVGGFIFTHDSPHDNKPGGMLTSFEPDKHFGLFNLENLHEEAERWQRDNKKRLEAGKQASAIVREQHCWHHRARQISDDLGK